MGQGQAKPPGPFTSEILTREHKNVSSDIIGEKACFAAGCFWGIELVFQRIPGVLNTSVGYTQGHVKNPTYRQVCSGTTGHTEAVEVTYDPGQIQFRELCQVFFEKIDPTTVNGQGNDMGTQYRTGIYYYNKEQQEVAEETKNIQQKKEIYPIATEIKAATEFYHAENNHQQYLEKGGQEAAKGSKVPIRCYG